MKTSLFKILLLSLTLLIPISSINNKLNAAPNIQLQNYFREQFKALNQNLSESDPNDSSPHKIATAKPEEAWMLSTFMLRIRPRFGFEIPEFASFFVIPEAELVWQQTLPDGWSYYTPPKNTEKLRKN